MLDKLDPHTVAADITELAGGRVSVLCYFERPHTGKWCHRALAELVPEFGFEGLAQRDHPLMAEELRRDAAL